jgi:aconitate hydratase
MCPEYGATVGFFAVDETSMKYLRQTGRDEQRIAFIEKYLKANKMFRHFENQDEDPVFSQVKMPFMIWLGFPPLFSQR